jgi:hypothetical protein
MPVNGGELKNGHHTFPVTKAQTIVIAAYIKANKKANIFLAVNFTGQIKRQVIFPFLFITY